jgi:hypothetical protein
MRYTDIVCTQLRGLIGHQTQGSSPESARSTKGIFLLEENIVFVRLLVGKDKLLYFVRNQIV